MCTQTMILMHTTVPTVHAHEESLHTTLNSGTSFDSSTVSICQYPWSSFCRIDLCTIWISFECSPNYNHLRLDSTSALDTICMWATKLITNKNTKPLTSALCTPRDVQHLRFAWGRRSWIYATIWDMVSIVYRINGIKCMNNKRYLIIWDGPVCTPTPVWSMTWMDRWQYAFSNSSSLINTIALPWTTSLISFVSPALMLLLSYSTLIMLARTYHLQPYVRGTSHQDLRSVYNHSLSDSIVTNIYVIFANLMIIPSHSPPAHKTHHLHC